LSKPFTVHTAFADARGDGRHQRVYAFVTTAGGEDLATLLVDQGLARAYGVSRAAPDDTPRDDYRSGLQDAELVAASRQRGIWKHTDWDRLPKERRDERREADLMARSMGRQPTPDQPVDLNGAAMDDLIRIPGIGEVLAHRIVENRPYVAVDDVSRVPGIGPVLLERIRPYVSVTP
jgi:predicted flap endonuclease-1-like 5' DNA nuclease